MNRPQTRAPIPGARGADVSSRPSRSPSGAESPASAWSSTTPTATSPPSRWPRCWRRRQAGHDHHPLPEPRPSLFSSPARRSRSTASCAPPASRSSRATVADWRSTANGSAPSHACAEVRVGSAGRGRPRHPARALRRSSIASSRPEIASTRSSRRGSRPVTGSVTPRRTAPDRRLRVRRATGSPARSTTRRSAPVPARRSPRAQPSCPTWPRSGLAWNPIPRRGARRGATAAAATARRSSSR